MSSSSPALLLAEEEAQTSSGAAAVLGENGSMIEISSSSNTAVVSKVIVHPLVLMSILDHHSRRAEGSGRVVGTLLGVKHTTGGGSSASEDSTAPTKTTLVEITNSFAVPHAERGDEVAFGTNYNKEMLNLHLLANKKESVVGWYATTSTEDHQIIVDTSSLVHEFYAGECEDGNPIHLAVDTTLQENALKIRAFQSAPVQLGSGSAAAGSSSAADVVNNVPPPPNNDNVPLANLFKEVRLQLQPNDSEAICLAKMATESSQDVTQTNPQLSLVVSMEKLLSVLEQISSYVDGVVEKGGQSTTDTDASSVALGYHIADALATVPRIRPQVFDSLFQDSLQDLLMVTYLSNITKTQLVIAEKLNETLTV